MLFIQEVCKMDILKTVLMILFAIDCIVLTAIVLLQEGKSAGLGTISGAAESYWGQNKGRSMEGALEHFTRYGAIVFMILTLVLNILMKTQG
jgi:preprotein translocase subunit SecG